MTRTSRRRVLRGTAGAAVVGATVVGATRPAAAQPSFDGWLSDVDNYDGVVDRTGQDEVTVAVGVEANGGAFGFGPAAVQVDPGTTVVWEWTGAGGQHNVVAESGGDFESDLVSDEGFTYEQTFEETGVVTYFCQPHLSLGMKGVVVVGDAVPTPAPDAGEGDGEGGRPLPGGVGAVVGAIVYASVGGVALLILGAEAYGELAHRGGVRGPSPDDPAEPVPEAPAETPERTVTHDEYDPWGTATLVAGYFVLLLVLWVFMYFVEFLGNGPTVVG